MYELDKWIQSLPNQPIFWIIATLAITSMAMFLIIVNAPLGYQDKNGFHLGEPKHKS